MTKPKEYFELDMDTLRSLGRWAADCAERALPIYETTHPADSRPREAIQAIRAFNGGEKRSQRLRVIALDAYRAALESKDPAASAAAQAASLATASAYTHPLKDAAQIKHILGPAAYAALALELYHCNDPARADEVVRWAIELIPAEVCTLLRNMPALAVGRHRVDQLMADLNAGVRGKG
jgi:hypothetical protein